MTDSGSSASRNLASNLNGHHRKLTQVNIHGLKELVLTRIPKTSPFREIILSEPDVLDTTEFLIKMDVWLRLLWTTHSHVRGDGK